MWAVEFSAEPELLFLRTRVAVRGLYAKEGM